MAIYDMHRGMEDEKRVRLLFRLTKLRSESMMNAVVRVLVRGDTVLGAANMEDVDESSLKKTLTRLNKINETVELIKEHDWNGKAKNGPI